MDKSMFSIGMGILVAEFLAIMVFALTYYIDWTQDLIALMIGIGAFVIINTLALVFIIKGLANK